MIGWESLSSFDYFSAAHTRYKESPHQRTVLFIKPIQGSINDSYFIVCDYLSGKEGRAKIQWLLHTAKEKTEIDTKKRLILKGASLRNTYKSGSTKAGGDVGLVVIPAYPTTISKVDNRKCYMSLVNQVGGFFATEDAKQISYIKETLPNQFSVLLYPYKGKSGKINFEPLLKEEDSHKAFKVVIDDLEDYIFLSQKKPSIHDYKGIKSDGRCGLIRIRKGEIERVVLIEGKRLSFNGKELIKAEKRISGIELLYKGGKLMVNGDYIPKTEIYAPEIGELFVNGKKKGFKKYRDYIKAR